MSEIKFQDIEDTFKQFMLRGDNDYIKLSYAAQIGNQILSRRPIWLMLVAPPSSGKTTALNAFNGLKIVNKSSGS
jgi:type VI protein secretion system component VasK